MITITPETFAVATAREERLFIDRLTAFLRETVPELADQPPPAMDAQVRLVIEAARGYGLRSEQAVSAYALTAALLGPDFVDRFPAAHAIMLDESSEQRKAEQLEAFTTALFDALD